MRYKEKVVVVIKFNLKLDGIGKLLLYQHSKIQLDQQLTGADKVNIWCMKPDEYSFCFISYLISSI